jgi:hypothetical protein
VEQAGARPEIVAAEFTINGLTRAIIAHFHSSRGAASKFSGVQNS